MIRRPLVLLCAGVCTLLAACSDAPVTPAGTDAAPLTSAAAEQALAPSPDNVWIMLFDRARVPQARAAAERLVNAHGGRLRLVFDGLHGFSAELPLAAAEALRRNPQVRLMAPNDPVETFGHVVQTTSSWGLDRVDQQAGRDGKYRYVDTGAGVHVFVVDNGIRATHQEFTGRLQVHDMYGGTGADCASHGTHVTSLAAGTTYGVAKAAQIHAVKASNCVGGLEKWLEALNFVRGRTERPAVVNLSMGIYRCSSGNNCDSPSGDMLDDAVRQIIAAGMPVVVAAGNSGQLACNVSPARVPEAITVAASDSLDQRWVASLIESSNYGSCVDVFAPGARILGAHSGSDIASADAWGTSFAAPFVTGAAALYLQRNPGASPATVHAHIINRATPNKLQGLQTGDPNRLVLTLAPLAVTISGPNDIDTTGTFTWTANPTGGVGHYTYQWRKRDILPDGVPMGWQTLGTAQTQSRTFVGYEQDFDLEVTVTTPEGSTVRVLRVDGPCGDPGMRICAS